MDGGVGADNNSGGPVQKELVFGAIVGIVSEMLEDWGTESDGVAADTLLAGDLGFASVDLIHLVVAIEEHFGQGRMNFQDLLIKDSRYVDDLTVGEIAAFVTGKLR
jgi:acyl carrier protein